MVANQVVIALMNRVRQSMFRIASGLELDPVGE